MDKLLSYLFITFSVVFMIVMFYGINRVNKVADICSDKNGILVKSSAGWVCVDKHVIRGRDA